MGSRARDGKLPEERKIREKQGKGKTKLVS